MMPTGQIQIELHHRDGKAHAVKIESNRDSAATRLLTGKTPQQLLEIVPLVFTLCGNAQAHAALSACQMALSISAKPDEDSARNMLVQLETLREHAWRILLDWPSFIGLTPDKKPLAALLKFDVLFKHLLFRNGEAFKLESRIDFAPDEIKQRIDELETLIDASIFQGGLESFRQITDIERLIEWLEQNDSLPARFISYIYKNSWPAIGQSAIDCLPALETETLNRHMQLQDLKSFSQTPHWQGLCFEASLLNRLSANPLIAELQSLYGNGLIVRTLARLMEVAEIPSRLTGRGEFIRPGRLPLHKPERDGIGLAQIQAARGLLIHRLELRQGRVYDYCIVAPTEWNFHPNGVLAQGLKNLKGSGPNDLNQQAKLLIHALDPCVAVTLNLKESNNA